MYIQIYLLSLIFISKLYKWSWSLNIIHKISILQYRKVNLPGLNKNVFKWFPVLQDFSQNSPSQMSGCISFSRACCSYNSTSAKGCDHHAHETWTKAHTVYQFNASYVFVVVFVFSFKRKSVSLSLLWPESTNSLTNCAAYFSFSINCKQCNLVMQRLRQRHVQCVLDK